LQSLGVAQRFESHRRLQLKTPVEVAPSPRARNAQPKPYKSHNSSMWFSAVELKRRFHDLPQLQNRMPEVR